MSLCTLYILSFVVILTSFICLNVVNPTVSHYHYNNIKRCEHITWLRPVTAAVVSMAQNGFHRWSSASLKHLTQLHYNNPYRCRLISVQPQGSTCTCALLGVFRFCVWTLPQRMVNIITGERLMWLSLRAQYLDAYMQYILLMARLMWK